MHNNYISNGTSHTEERGNTGLIIGTNHICSIKWNV